MDPDSWTNLPDNSAFTLRVSGATAGCEALAFVSMDGNQLAVWSNAQLVAGKTMTLSAPHQYSIDLQVTFVSSTNSTVNVDASVSDSAGNVLGTPYSETTSGVTNDSDSAEFTVYTAV